MERGGTTNESVATPRQRTETSKGSDFRKELILKDVNCSFRILKAKTGRLKKLLLENTEVSTVRKDYSEWMVLFEAYLNQHDIYCGLLSLSEVEEYNHEIYENRDIYICNFRCHIQEWLRQAESDVDSHISKGSKTSRHSRSSRHSVSSSISSLKLQEENKKIELTARANALKEKHKLDKARLDIEHREEQLEIDTELQISSEKSNLLKNLSNDDNKSVRSTTSVKEVVLTPSVEPTDERTPAVEPVLSVQTEPAVKYVPSDESAQFSASLARHLRKPATNIKSFSGDVLNYHKFIRQFKSLVISNCESFDEKMTFLEQFTTGEAYRFVSSCSYKKSSEEAYTSAMRLLEERYGDKEVVANAFVNRALKWPEIRSDNPKALDDFVLFLTECSNAIESIESEKHLDFAETVRIILRKLPYSIQDKYRTLKDSNRGKSTPLKFVDLLNLLQTESRKANDPMFGKLALISERRISERRPFTVKPKGSYATQFSSSASGNKNNRDGSCGTNNKFTPFTSKNGTQNVDIAFTKPCAYCNHPSHRMDCCRELSSLSYEKKSDFVRSKRLCFGCLKIGHVGHFCKNNPRCELCSRPHHTVLHPTNTSNNNTYNRTDKPAVTGAISNMSIADEDTSGNCAMAIIPVVAKLKNGLNTVCTYAFLDPGSSISFCSTNLIRRLAGHGKKLSLTIDTMGTPHTFTSQVIKGIQISDLTQENVIDLPIVYTKDEMPVTKRHIPTNQEIQRWPHLRDISLPIINSEIELLIGNNVPDVYSITDFRNGPSGSPNAVKSPLGWIIWNLMRDGIPESTAVVNRATISSIQDYEEINTMVTKMYNYDFPEAIKKEKTLKKMNNFLIKLTSQFPMLTATTR